jgi:hypothetical protein
MNVGPNLLAYLIENSIGQNWKFSAWFIIALEFFLFFTFLFIRDDSNSVIRTIISIIGILFHFALTIATYRIRAFSLYMILFYTLTIVPNYVFSEG